MFLNCFQGWRGRLNGMLRTITCRSMACDNILLRCFVRLAAFIGGLVCPTKILASQFPLHTTDVEPAVFVDPTRAATSHCRNSVGIANKSWVRLVLMPGTSFRLARPAILNDICRHNRCCRCFSGTVSGRCHGGAAIDQRRKNEENQNVHLIALFPFIDNNNIFTLVVTTCRGRRLLYNR